MEKYGSGPYSDGGVFHACFTAAAVGICTFWKAYFATVDCAQQRWAGRANTQATSPVTHTKSVAQEALARRFLRSFKVTNKRFIGFSHADAQQASIAAEIYVIVRFGPVLKALLAIRWSRALRFLFLPAKKAAKLRPNRYTLPEQGLETQTADRGEWLSFWTYTG